MLVLSLQHYQSRLNVYTNKLYDEDIYWENRIQVTRGKLVKARSDYEETEKKIAHMRNRVQQYREAQQQQLELIEVRSHMDS